MRVGARVMAYGAVTAATLLPASLPDSSGEQATGAGLACRPPG